MRHSQFIDNEQVVINWCDSFTFIDNWVQVLRSLPTALKKSSMLGTLDTLGTLGMLGMLALP